MAELQAYLRSVGHPHSTRELARLTGIAQSTIAEQLTIADALPESNLAKVGISTDDLARVPHSTLLRIAKLPPYLRNQPLIQATRGADVTAEPIPTTAAGGTRKASVREMQRAAAYNRMREEGDFQVTIPKPVGELSTKEANEYLDDLLPAVANIAEAVIGASRSYYIGLTGNGGILVYLRPASRSRRTG